MKSKKAVIFSISLVLITFTVLLSTFIAVYQKHGQFDDVPLAIQSYNILLANQKAEKATFYLEQAGKYILEESITELAQKGGFTESSPCGKYGTSNLWNNKDNFCPPPYLKSLGKIFSQKLGPFIQNYPEETIFPSTYEFSLSNNKLIAIPLSPIETKIDMAGESHLNYIGKYFISPSFKLSLTQNLNYPLLFQQAKDFVQECTNQPLSYINNGLPLGWELHGGELMLYLGTPNNQLTSVEELKEHKFKVTQNNIETTFALYIDSDIPNSGTPTQYSLSESDSLTFTDSNGDSHTLTIISINSDGTVTITITSDPLTFTLQQGEEKIIDVTGDSTYDIYLKLNQITTDNKADLTLTVFDKPQEDADIIEAYLSGTQWDLEDFLSQQPNDPYYSQNKLCAKSGSYGNDFNTNILNEWSARTGYNPCYVAAFVQGECSWDITLCNSLGYCGMFQWGAAAFSDLKNNPSTYPNTALLNTHSDIINLGLADQLNILEEFFKRWNIQPEDGLGKMYQSVAFPWCIDHTEDGTTNLDTIVPRTSQNNPLWRYPNGPEYATCRGIAHYAHSKALADSSLSFCSCICEGNQQNCNFQQESPEYDYSPTTEGTSDANCIILYGDTRSNHNAHQEVVNQISTECDSPTLIHTGDFVATGTNQEQWNTFWEIEENLINKGYLYTVVGNHETSSNIKTYLGNHAPYIISQMDSEYGTYIKEITDNLILIVLNDNTGVNGRITFVESALASNLNKNIILAHHKPVVPILEGHNDDNQYFILIHEQLVNHESNGNKVIVVNGHVHGLTWGVKDGIDYITSGGGGAGLYAHRTDGVPEEYYDQLLWKIDYGYFKCDSNLNCIAKDEQGNTLFTVP